MTTERANDIGCGKVILTYALEGGCELRQVTGITVGPMQIKVMYKQDGGAIE